MIKRIQERLSSSNSKQAQILATQKWTSLRSVVLGAEPADPTVIQNMHDVLGIPREAIKNAYGMAETGAFVSCGFARIMDGVVACGPMEGYSKLILVKQQPSGDETNDDTDDANDENQGRPIRELVTTEGDIGEIWVKSPLSASGYWGQEQLSKETFRNKLPLNVDPTDADWLATGDLGRSQNGELFVTGRKKELIIINGKNYFPVDLERAVEQSFVELVRPGCTVAYQHSATQVGVVLELRKGIKARQAPTPAAIKQAVSRETGVGLQHILILQNKVDLVKPDAALAQQEQIRKFVAGTVADSAPILPISAVLKYNIDAVCEYLVRRIPLPPRDFTSVPRLIVIRSFDVNRPGQDVSNLQGGVAGGSILQGVLRVGDEIEVRPGIVTKKEDDEGRMVCSPIFSRISSLYAESNDLQFAVPGGLIGVGTRIDPTLTRADRLVGQVLGLKGQLPDVFSEIEISYYLLRRLLGVKTSDGGKQAKVQKLSKGEILMVNIGSTATGGKVQAVKGDLAKIALTQPVCTQEGEKIALSRRVDKHWRLIGWGQIRKGSKIEVV